ncbi:RNA polymerase sigma factor [Caballeronia sp. LZ034LL]|uniref:RNA polymerase sigma factor n=1 Tax=Caballeronia sp. LZ034LL TaxID=3038567 RepID=UPI0028576EB1|nr:RNA polymerase sigma factor [Caballeronia sp. LZ034LL]MDR5838739.1 RNA polymerase sigma factor [Caballeronia sp. LZ034LL]
MWQGRSRQDKAGRGEHADPQAAMAMRARFEATVMPHLDAAYNLARWLSGNASDADDVVQEAYLRAFRFFGGFDGGAEANARAWLLAIVRNTWFTEWRRRVQTADATPYDEELGGDEALPGWSEEGGADPETLAVRRDEIHLVHRALEALPVAFREVLVLRELEDMSYKEVASVTGVPIGTVMSRLARGRKMLAGAVRAAQGGQDRPSVRLVRRAGPGQSEESGNGK